MFCHLKLKGDKTDIVPIGIKQRFSCDNSYESAVCHVAGVDNDINCACLGERLRKNHAKLKKSSKTQFL